MKRLFKYFKPRYWELKRILSDIKEAKELILDGRHSYLCHAFGGVDDRYHLGSEVAKYIPNLIQSF